MKNRKARIESHGSAQAPRVRVQEIPLSTELLRKPIFYSMLRHQSCRASTACLVSRPIPPFSGRDGKKWSFVMRSTALAAILASTTVLSGCAGTIAGVSIGSISSFAGFASTIFTGADLGEHAASLVTGKSCRFSEGLARDDRDVCEEAGSSATRDDFRGIFVERVEADGTIIYAAPKYMPASVGAGENENNTDIIWAQIKQQKQLEDAQRQIARTDRGLHIDVAALASGQLSKDSLTFLPATSSADVGDEEPASLTATGPRDFSNPTDGDRSTVARHVQAASDEPPVIDEKSLTITMKIAQATGSGGPFIAPAASSKPVAQ
jgi:hypothetical protein